jgi:hypothetical protein
MQRSIVGSAWAIQSSRVILGRSKIVVSGCNRMGGRVQIEL